VSNTSVICQHCHLSTLLYGRQRRHLQIVFMNLSQKLKNNAKIAFYAPRVEQDIEITKNEH
jgi:hypothetical protein